MSEQTVRRAELHRWASRLGWQWTGWEVDHGRRLRWLELPSERTLGKIWRRSGSGGEWCWQPDSGMTGGDCSTEAEARERLLSRCLLGWFSMFDDWSTCISDREITVRRVTGDGGPDDRTLVAIASLRADGTWMVGSTVAGRVDVDDREEALAVVTLRAMATADLENLVPGDEEFRAGGAGDDAVLDKDLLERCRSEIERLDP